MKKDKPSKTARKVALNILTLGAKHGMDQILPAGLVDSTAALLIASGAVSETAVRWSRSPRMIRVYEAFDWMMPGQFEAFAHRKAFCEKQVRDGIAAGATQILVLGAGYDTMGWRLAPEFPNVSFFEIDHPATARLKAKGIEAMGLRKNLYLLAEDLGEKRLADVIQANETWRSDGRTVIVAEGLVMYLAAPAVKDLFIQCSSVTAAGSRIAFSYIPTAADGRPDAGPKTGMVLWILKAGGEPWLWSIRPEELGPFLEDTGWVSAPELMASTEKRGVELFAVATRSR